MRVKTMRLVITFHTTAQAIAAERFFKENGIPGRLIPVPREITAGCGMAWSAPPEEEGRIRDVMEQKLAPWEGWHRLRV